MKTTVSEYDFCRAFETSSERKDTFTHSAQKALYDYLVQYEDDCGEEIELDIVALCCDYSEYESAVQCIKDCGYTGFSFEASDDESEEENEERKEEEALEWLGNQTSVIPFDGTIELSDGTILGNRGVIIQRF